MLACMCCTAALLPTLGVMTTVIIKEQARATLMAGLAADVITILYYGSPLTAAVRVVRTKSSASIMLPRLLCDIANSGLWTA